MARVICQAIIRDSEEMKAVIKELKSLHVRSQVYRDYIHVDYYSKDLGKIRQVEDVFYGLKYGDVQQIG